MQLFRDKYHSPLLPSNWLQTLPLKVIRAAGTGQGDVPARIEAAAALTRTGAATVLAGALASMAFDSVGAA